MFCRLSCQTTMFCVLYTRGGFRGKEADAPPPPSGIRPPADPKGPPFDTFSEIHFWPTDPKIFLKAHLAPIYTNFEEERAPKKTRFFCQNFSKSAQKWLFLLFFQKFACGAEILAKIGAKQCFGKARKINLVDLKKGLNFVLKIRPPFEKILDPPLLYTVFFAVSIAGRTLFFYFLALITLFQLSVGCFAH